MLHNYAYVNNQYVNKTMDQMTLHTSLFAAFCCHTFEFFLIIMSPSSSKLVGAQQIIVHLLVI